MLPKGPYNPNETEPEILNFWLDGKFYKPEFDPKTGKLMSLEEMQADPREPFCIVCPPPNSYARAHVGNLSGDAYQDVFARYARMNGKKVLMIPGKDHAAQEAEVIYLRDVLGPQGKKKSDFTREEFYQQCYTHFSGLAKTIQGDEQTIGLSADFDRDIFTLDPRIAGTIYSTFFKMFDDGMVYKDVRIVNWSPGMGSIIPDIETDRKEREADLVYIKYPLADDPQKFVAVATTRPETMLGDTAVVVDPGDERYKDLIGKYVQLPLTDRKIPIIANGRVDKEFGTGAVKLTPAHAPDDYTMMLEWNYRKDFEHMPDYVVKAREDIGEVTYVNVISRESKMVGPSGKYAGMEVLGAREQMINDLQEQGLIEKIEKITQNVLICDRSKTVIEPIMSSQWFVDVDKLKQPAIDAIKSGKVVIHPESMQNKMLHWLENLRDWPISRSIWWGYQFPVWYKGEPTEEVNAEGKIVIKIAGEEISGMQDAVQKGLMKVQKHSPDSTVIDFTRHGETDYNIEKRFAGHSDVDINEKGTAQAESFRSDIKYDLIVCSDLTRAKHTAEIIARNLNISKIITEKNFREKSFGRLEGLTRPEAIELFPEFAADIYDLVDNHPDLAGVESIKELEERVLNAIENIKTSYPGKNVLVVAHGGVLRTVAHRLNGKDYNEIVKAPHGNLDLERLRIQPHNSEWAHDPDVFDTWFSSGQWPFATLTAWGLMDAFYPTQVMEMAYGILELWASRMIMLGLYVTGEVPFKDVYIQGHIKAADGRKMSKSLGNNVNIDELNEKYGIDAVRLFYLVGNKAGADYRIDYEKLEGYRRYLNKIWNASKFVTMNTGELSVAEVQELKLEDLQQESNKKLLQHIQDTHGEVTKLIDNFNIGIASQVLFENFWHTFCDICLEEAKPHVYVQKNKETGEVISEPNAEEKAETQKVLLYALVSYLKMLHPFIPFITEQIWQLLPGGPETAKSLMYAEWQ